MGYFKYSLKEDSWKADPVNKPPILEVDQQEDNYYGDAKAISKIIQDNALKGIIVVNCCRKYNKESSLLTQIHNRNSIFVYMYEHFINILNASCRYPIMASVDENTYENYNLFNTETVKIPKTKVQIFKKPRRYNNFDSPNYLKLTKFLSYSDRSLSLSVSYLQRIGFNDEIINCYVDINLNTQNHIVLFNYLYSLLIEPFHDSSEQTAAEYLFINAVNAAPYYGFNMDAFYSAIIYWSFIQYELQMQKQKTNNSVRRMRNGRNSMRRMRNGRNSMRRMHNNAKYTYNSYITDLSKYNFYNFRVLYMNGLQNRDLLSYCLHSDRIDKFKQIIIISLQNARQMQLPKKILSTDELPNFRHLLNNSTIELCPAEADLEHDHCKEFITDTFLTDILGSSDALVNKQVAAQIKEFTSTTAKPKAYFPREITLSQNTASNIKSELELYYTPEEKIKLVEVIDKSNNTIGYSNTNGNLDYYANYPIGWDEEDDRSPLELKKAHKEFKKMIKKQKKT